MYLKAYFPMPWPILLHPDFDQELGELPTAVQRELAALVLLLEEFGPQLKRPRCDTLKGSKHANMKELRFDAADGVWRVAFAFDTERHAVLLVAGDKSGTSQKKFYKALLRVADRRFDDWLEM
jgi:hypothetical protein